MVETVRQWNIDIILNLFQVVLSTSFITFIYCKSKVKNKKEDLKCLGLLIKYPCAFNKFLS